MITRAARPVLPTLRLSSATVCLVLFVLAVNTAEAQQVVSGTVTERGSGQPVEGAMVVLLSEGGVAASVLSAANGSFTMRVRRPGRYEVRIDRIGYSSTYSGAFDLASGGKIERRIETQVRPVALRGLDVSGARRCEVRPARGLATAIVWEEVRKALAAATWTRERELYQFRWLHYVRELDADTPRVLDEQRTRGRAYTSEPYRSLDPDTLAAYGFVSDRTGEVLYTAPDARVLLSDPFLDFHCFSLDSKSEEGRRFVGLRFEPVPGRRLPEVRGVLWVDEESGHLESLEYEYVNVVRGARIRGDGASGHLFFRALPNGTWIVEDWNIRMPRLVGIQDELGQIRRYDVRGYVEEGGSVTEIATSAGVALSATSTIIHGSVTDSVGSPSEGARVWLAGTDLETTTNADGNFHFDDVGAGTWSVRASHASLGAFGYPGSVARQVTVERDAISRVQVELPSIASFVSDGCRSSEPVDPESVILVGRVLHADGTPAPDAEVRIAWTQRSGTFQSSFEGHGTDADSIGVFTVCAVPTDRGMVASASLGDELSGTTDFRFREATGVVPIEIRLERATDDPVPEARWEPSVADREEKAWLASVGFDLRGDRALMHRTNREVLDLGYDSLSLVLEEIPRVEAREIESGKIQFRLHPTPEWSPLSDINASCELGFYLNGSLVRQRIDGNWELQVHRLVTPKRLTAIEVFEGSMSPVGAPEDCGYVLVWVRYLRHDEDPAFTGTVQGRVLGLNDLMPADSVTLSIEPGFIKTGVDDDGRFDFGSLPPAVYIIEASIPGWGVWSTEVELRAQATVDLMIEVGQGLRFGAR